MFGEVEDEAASGWQCRAESTDRTVALHDLRGHRMAEPVHAADV